MPANGAFSVYKTRQGGDDPEPRGLLKPLLGEADQRPALNGAQGQGLLFGPIRDQAVKIDPKRPQGVGEPHDRRELVVVLLGDDRVQGEARVNEATPLLEHPQAAGVGDRTFERALDAA